MIDKKTVAIETPTLSGFIEAFSIYAQESGSLVCYRGQRDRSWQNEAGIFRAENKNLLAGEYRAVREMISVQPHEFSSDDTMLERLVRMQHFGLPTRLLDVTHNALVALYVATGAGDHTAQPTDGFVIGYEVPPQLEKFYDSDSVSCIANLANLTEAEKARLETLIDKVLGELSGPMDIKAFNDNEVVDRLLQFVRAEKPYFKSRLKPQDLFTQYFVHPKLSNRRILAQSGAFIITGLTQSTRFLPYDIVLTKFVVPKECKTSVRKSLDSIGINESALYPEIDKAAKRIKLSYQSRPADLGIG